MGATLTKCVSRSWPLTADNNDEVIRIVMVGKTGAGKSATGNTILGEKCFKSEFSFKSVTTDCEKADGEVYRQKVAVIDTPDLFDTRNPEEKTHKDIDQCITYASPGPHIFLIIIRLDRFTEEEKQILKKIQEHFGEEAYKYSMVLFTHGNQLKGKPIEEFLEGSKDLKKLVDKCKGQYHVLNNKGRFQCKKLLKKIKKIKEENGGSYYTDEMFQKAKRAIEVEKQRILKEKEEQNRKEQEQKKVHHPTSRSTPPTVFNNNELIRIVMVGNTGVAKNATGNTILGQKCFKSEFSHEPLTTVCEKVFGEVDGQKVAVIDTLGLFDTKNTEEKTDKDISQCISYAAPGPHIFLIVIKVDRFTEEEKQTVQKIQEIFGEEADKYSMVLFTHGEQLKGKSIEEFLKNSKELQELVNKCQGQYHVFNNEVKDRFQVKKLLEKIKKINEQNGGSYYTTEMFKKAKREQEGKKQQISKEKEEKNCKEQEKLAKNMEGKMSEVLPPTSMSTPPTVDKNDEEIRIVMVGKTGVGKSATGNTILGQKCFDSEFCPVSLTIDCKKAFGEVNGQKVVVIDTPGLYDTRNPEEKTVKDISPSISDASPGPHIFLIIIKVDRFTEEEKQTVQKIQEIFGKEAFRYSMFLFTHGDKLKGKPIEEFLRESEDLKELVDKCNGQYHVFNNELEDRSQVSELLEKIKKINEQNGGSYYTTEMFQKAERANEEEKQQILKEKEEKNCKELEEVVKEKYEQQMKEERDAKQKENEVRDFLEAKMKEEIEQLEKEQGEKARHEA